MSENPTQSFANHRRFDPSFHFLLFGLFAANAVISVWALIRMFRSQHFDFATLWSVVMAVTFLLFFLKLRVYALHNQDRLIRLEERLRMKALLPATLATRALELRPSQYVALRFASDEELPGLVQQTLDENLASGQIKKRIRTWRPDTFRI
ncbi:MAG: hypothetical protein IPQ13_11340 [Holophagaceae bacterium]|nr:hypothetical protein [Holophagaceae bacterium]